MRAPAVFAIVGCFALLTSGCAMHYYDKETGTEHVWGMGHMKMKSTPIAENIDSVVSGTSVAGVGIGAGRSDCYIIAGWDYRRRIVMATNAAMSLVWPTADFFNARVGNRPPFLMPMQSNLPPTNELEPRQ